MIEMKSNLTFIKKPELFAALKSFESQFYAVIDEKLKSHLPEWILSSDKVFWLTNPEAQKTLQTYGEISEFFLEKGIYRSATLIAIGGGATTDLAGYVASTILRGVEWMAVPTTLLAQVDGAIGGKVAINTNQGKNLLGAFHNPKMVYLCHDFLITLPEVEMISGKGEILKYGFLSTQISNLILNHAELETIIFECAKYKSEVVEKDFKETGERILLNLGHTLGHAFESSLKIPHGVSVAMGIHYLMLLFAQTEELKTWNKLVVSLAMPLDQLQLSHYPSFSLEALKKYLTQDKKKDQEQIKLVMVKSVGHCETQSMKLSEFLKKIEDHEAFH
jgi:3-dehydroquinate synthase